MLVQFIKTHKDAKLPKKNHPHPQTGDAGFDIFSVETVTIPARGSAIVNVGLEVAHITPGFWYRIEGRSGLGFKKGLRPHYGVIDNGYRGEKGIKLFNDTDQDQVLEKGTAVAQFITFKMYDTLVSFVEEKTESNRGEKGFGSSDLKK